MKTVEEGLGPQQGRVAPVGGARPEGSIVTASPVLDTTELRWFAGGRIPSAVTQWFTCAGMLGAFEERRDVYRMDGRDDVGVKLRSGETLEVKTRQSTGERVELAAGPQGLFEVWHKWSPAENRPADGGHERWIDVHKKIVKRWFSADGREIIAPGESPPMSGAGCNVEVASVSVGEIEAWTFAFAAFGPTHTRRDSITMCWRALLAGAPFPEPYSFGHSRGYAEWLEEQCGRTRSP